MKRISCGDLIPGCDFKAQARSDAEVLSVEVDHLRETHNLGVTPQLLQRAKDRIVEVDAAADAEPRLAARRG